jgi:pimeloyl-ACP methyl ester carboxylesterase
MKWIVVFLLYATLTPCVAQSQHKSIDTLIDAGGYRLHFNVITGKGTPILFEAGGGEDATTWGDLLNTVNEITQTTVISYDRAGFGKSTFDTTRHGILNGIKGLEAGLTKLGYNGNILLVAHSQGGLYATLYSSRHPDKVKGVVFIDATTSCFYQEKRLAATQRSIDENNRTGKSKPGPYYQGADFSGNINYVRNVSFPGTVPAIDLVADNPPFSDSADITDWKACHRQFASASANRTGITAYGCGHFIFKDNPQLVILSIIDVYSATLDKASRSELLTRTLNYAIHAANSEGKK